MFVPTNEDAAVTAAQQHEIDIKAWDNYDEEQNFRTFCGNGVMKTMGVSFAVGIVFGVITCLLIFAAICIKNACSSGYGRLSMLDKSCFTHSKL